MLVGLLVLGFAGHRAPADAQSARQLTIVRPTDPVALEPNLETTAPARGLLQTCSRGC